MHNRKEEAIRGFNGGVARAVGRLGLVMRFECSVLPLFGARGLLLHLLAFLLSGLEPYVAATRGCGQCGQ